jgi:hypothetical protein
MTDASSSTGHTEHGSLVALIHGAGFDTTKDVERLQDLAARTQQHRLDTGASRETGLTRSTALWAAMQIDSRLRETLERSGISAGELAQDLKLQTETIPPGPGPTQLQDDFANAMSRYLDDRTGSAPVSLAEVVLAILQSVRTYRGGALPGRVGSVDAAIANLDAALRATARSREEDEEVFSRSIRDLRAAEVDLGGVRPGALELLVLADTIASRRGTAASALEVVLAAVVRPTVSGLHLEQLRSGATYALYAAVPDPKDEHLDAALIAAGAGSYASMAQLDGLDLASGSSALSRSPELAALVEQASRLAADVPAVVSKSVPPPEVYSHHLLGVALAQASLPLAVARSLGVDDDALRAAFLAAVRERWPGEDAARWAALLAQPAGAAVATFHHDDTRQRDLLAEDSLDIEPHVRALALLVTSKVLKPPLAVGLFGDWGSGKTYFMRALRQEVDRLTHQARHSDLLQRELPVYRNVAQIEFNAWHFVDADLWASLADYIFANLRITEGERPDQVSLRRDLYVAKLSEQGAAIRQVETERQHLQARIEQSETELEQVRSQTRRQLGIEEKTRASLEASPGLKKDVDELAVRLGLPQVGRNVADLEEALVRARAATTGAGSAFGVLSGRFGTGWSLLAVAAVLVGPLVLWLTRYIDLDAIQRAAAIVAGFIGGVAALIRTAADAGSRTRKRIDDLGAAIEQEVESNPEVMQGRQKVEDLKAQEGRLADEETQLRKDLAKVEQALRELSPAKLLADFILSRSDSDDYRKHLGLASLIRRDFEALAEHIDEFNSSLESEEAAPDTQETAADTTEADQQKAGDVGTALNPPPEKDYHVNRIVLYIDDLDRCPPETVAKVLQAVHLLLAFPLFVVVVGVDARWLSRSLTKHYQGLLDSSERNDDNGSASPQDYLEKIFQIPFWLRPMPLDATGRLLDALTATQASSDSDPGGKEGEEEEQKTSDAPGSKGPGRTRHPEEGDRAPFGGDSGEPTPPQPPDTETRTRSQDSESRAVREPPAYNLRISPTEVTQSERNFMQVLRPMLGRSPRSLTRYVNIFRLLKAVDQHDRTADHGDRPGAQRDPDDVTMFLLAVLTAYPDVAQPLLSEMARRRAEDEADDSLTAVVRRVRRQVHGPEGETVPEHSSPGEDQWDLLEQWLGEHEDWARAQHVGTWGRKAQRVARYSYRFDAIAPARAEAGSATP